jgi:AP2 domain
LIMLLNRNGLDNRRFNLRFATHHQNTFNSTKRKNTSSKYKGVTWHSQIGKWMAQIQNKKVCGHKYIGVFDREIDAAKAYNSRAKILFGEFAVLNEIYDA